MLKAIWLMSRNPDVPLVEFFQHWFEVHAQLHLQPGHRLSGYVQHHTHVSTYDQEPRPTHDGVSIIWVPDVETYRSAWASTPFIDAVEDGKSGVRGHLPLGRRPLPSTLAEEKVILEGETNPLMVKAIYLARRNPAVPRHIFFRHWEETHGPLCAVVPGLRRYVQNHAVDGSDEFSDNAYDGWSELWFDNLDSFYQAQSSAEWSRLHQDGLNGVGGEHLWAELCLVIGRERWLLARRIA